MKVSSASTSSETSTPPVKKLKQARLPFQVITPEDTKPLEAKKRKLSEEKDETPNKIVKKSIAKEFKDDVKDDYKSDEPLTISDDDNIETNEEENKISPKSLNPLVSIVDIALKKKLLKKKSSKVTPKEAKTRSRKRKISLKNNEQTPESKDKIENTQTEPVNDEEKDIKVGNKENISHVILIEDSNDCEMKEVDQELKNDNDCEMETVNQEPKESSEITSHDNVECHKSTNVCQSSESTLMNESPTDEAAKIKPVIENSNEKGISQDESKQDISDTDEVNNMTSNTSVMSSSDDDEVNQSATELTECDTPTRKSNNKNIVTPKSKNDATADSPHTPADPKKLTPRQLQKKIESAKKQQEREKERLEKLRKKQEEKDEKNRQRLEREEQKRKEREEKEEQKRKEREEKEEQRKKEKEEKEKQKDLERKEREEKEEAKKKDREEKELQKKREREAKEEERRKKELEKEEDKKKKEIEKEEAEIKKKKAAAAFVNFFVPKASSSKQVDDSEPVIKNNLLSNFRKKTDMRLAPLNRKILGDEQKQHLEEHLSKQQAAQTDMYIKQIKNKSYDVGWSAKTWPLEDEDVMVVEDELPIDSVDFIPEESHKQKMKAKLFSFSENRRPPYWGTWRRKSKHICGRKPFGMDSNILDYEVDSDDEWEEEEPGESVGGSVAGSDDEEEENDYDIDNDFMVPHGYLSEEEAMCDEDEVLSPESQKAKLKIMQCEFEKEMKKNTEKLHPRSIGIIWQTSDGGRPDSCKESLWDFLFNKRILTEEDHVVIKPKQVVMECALEETKGEKSAVKKSRKITEEMIPQLINLVHGNVNNRGFLAHEFQTHLAKTNSEINAENSEEYINVSKMSIAKKIKEISKWMSCPIEGPMLGKMCWCVSKDIFEKYNVTVQLPNKWDYVLKTKKKNKPPVPQITQFLNMDHTSE